MRVVMCLCSTVVAFLPLLLPLFLYYASAMRQARCEALDSARWASTIVSPRGPFTQCGHTDQKTSSCYRVTGAVTEQGRGWVAWTRWKKGLQGCLEEKLSKDEEEKSNWWGQHVLKRGMAGTRTSPSVSLATPPRVQQLPCGHKIPRPKSWAAKRPMGLL